MYDNYHAYASFFYFEKVLDNTPLKDYYLNKKGTRGGERDEKI